LSADARAAVVAVVVADAPPLAALIVQAHARALSAKRGRVAPARSVSSRLLMLPST